MTIRILPNVNIFCFSALFNLIGYDEDYGKPFHPIRTQVRNDLSKFKNNQDLINLKNCWQTNKLTLSRLSAIALCSEDGFVDFPGPSFDIKYVKEFEPFVSLLFQACKSLKLIEYYKEKQQKYYEILINDLDKGIQQFHLGKTLDEFWGISLSDKGILYPNPLYAYSFAHCGLINGINISIAGPFGYDPVKNETIFTARSAIKSLMHEYSHAYVHKINDSIKELEDKTYKEKTAQLFNYAKKEVKKKNLISPFSNYNNWDTYFNEHIVRACETVFITPKVFTKLWTEEETSHYINSKIEDVRNKGFVFIDDVIDNFQEVLNNKGTIKEALLKTIDYCFEKYVKN